MRVLLVLALILHTSLACTSISVGPKASKDGSTFVTHGSDCYVCDFRLGKVPAQKHKNRDYDPVYFAKLDYPRFISEDPTTSPVYRQSNLEPNVPWTWNETKPMGKIPASNHSYAYLDALYAVQNEYQLGFGESTCTARLGPKGVPVQFGGHALFDISQLTKVAAARCKTARCAVKLMGQLAEEYGFYAGSSLDWNAGPVVNMEGGEALSINDPHEVWVFNICPDDTGKSAIWAAQRVPDDHVAVIHNRFSIHQIDLHDEDNFMASKNIYDVAIRNKFWSPDSNIPFDFQQVYAVPGGYAVNGVVYQDRRKWRVFDRIAPSQRFSPFDNPDEMPFSVKPDSKLSVQDVMSLHRDYYQGTPFDMSKEVVAGPFGDPTRPKLPPYPPYTTERKFRGNMERSVAQTWTSYTFVVQARSWLPNAIGGRAFFGPQDAITTVFTPIYAGALTVPGATAIGSLLSVNRESYYWPIVLTNNFALRFFSRTIKRLQSAQLQVENEILHRAETMEQQLMHQYQAMAEMAGVASVYDNSDNSPASTLSTLAVPTYTNTQAQDTKKPSSSSSSEDGVGIHKIVQIVADFSNHACEYARTSWLQLYDDLVVHFHDGLDFTLGPTLVETSDYYESWFIDQLSSAEIGMAQWHTIAGKAHGLPATHLPEGETRKTSSSSSPSHSPRTEAMSASTASFYSARTSEISPSSSSSPSLSFSSISSIPSTPPAFSTVTFIFGMIFGGTLTWVLPQVLHLRKPRNMYSRLE